MQEIHRDNGQKLSFEAALAAMSGADYVLLGEIHDNRQHHAAQAAIVAALGGKGRFRQLYFEMLEPAHDDAVASYLAGESSLGALERATRWSERGWPVWEAYGEIFAAARQRGMRVSHGNPDRALIRDINSNGFAGLPEPLRQELRIRPEGPFVVDFAALVAEIGRHHPMAEDQAARFVLSQYVKDAHMARRLASTPAGILIAGRGHVRADLGIPAHLAAYRPGARILAVALVGEEPASAGAARRIAHADGQRLYDLVWFTGEPCAAPH